MPFPVVAAHDYIDPISGLIVAYKERGNWGLERLLGERLALAVAALLARRPGPVLLVPIPSRRRAVRARGLDTTRQLARAAARRINLSLGIDATVASALRFRREVADQAGLDAVSRQKNLSGSLAARPLVRGVQVVIVDDVCTTGATLTEAMRVATAEGWPVVGTGVVAAARLHSDSHSSAAFAERKGTAPKRRPL